MSNGNFEEIAETNGVHVAAAQAAERDSVLMVRSFNSPYSVPYPEYVEELQERNGSIPESAKIALEAIYDHVSQTARERAESLKLG